MGKLFVFIFLLCLSFLPKVLSFFPGIFEARLPLEGKIGSMQLSWFGPQVFQNITCSLEDAKVELESMEIKAPFWSFSGDFEMKNGTFSYSGPSIEHIFGSFSGDQISLKASKLNGYASVSGKIHSELKFLLKIDIHQFPLNDFHPHFISMLGPTLDIKGTAQRDGVFGSLDLQVSSKHIQGHFLGKFDNQGLFLEKPLLMSVFPTKELTEALSEKLSIPILSKVASQTPFYITVDPEGFFLPFRNTLQNLSIEKGTIDLGQCEWELKEALPQNNLRKYAKETLLSSLNLSSGEINTWFTSIPFQVKEGIAWIERADVFLNNTFHVCGWGKIDLLKENLFFTIGLPKKFLEKAFNIKDLPEKYILQVELEGPLKAPQILKAQAIGKIGALIARNKSSFLRWISSPKVDESIPPQKKPFPWVQAPQGAPSI